MDRGPIEAFSVHGKPGPMESQPYGEPALWRTGPMEIRPRQAPQRGRTTEHLAGGAPSIALRLFPYKARCRRCLSPAVVVRRWRCRCRLPAGVTAVVSRQGPHSVTRLPPLWGWYSPRGGAGRSAPSGGAGGNGGSVFTTGRHRENLGMHQEKPGKHRESSWIHRESSGIHWENPRIHRERSMKYWESPGMHRDSPGMHQESSWIHRQSSWIHERIPGMHRDSPRIHRESSWIH